MTVFGIIYAILKAIPALKGWWEEFATWYIAREIDNMKKENQEAVRNAINLQDQRDIERALGSSKVGLPSDIPGSRIVDHLPGVDNKPN